MINLTDTHTHLYLPEFENDLEPMMKRAKQFGINRFFLPNIDVKSIIPMKDLVSKYRETCFPMMGLHPCSVDQDYMANLTIIKQELDSSPYLAVGEIGIDLYWDKTFRQEQSEAFKMQCRWARDKNLPIVIHCRNAMNETIALLDLMIADTMNYGSAPWKGIFHCFSGTAEDALKITAMGLHLGIGGVLTYKNSGLAEAIENIDLDKLVLETDSPYLAPVPHRGKRNESSYLRHVAEKLAAIKQCSLLEIAEITTQNSKQIFGV